MKWSSLLLSPLAACLILPAEVFALDVSVGGTGSSIGASVGSRDKAKSGKSGSKARQKSNKQRRSNRSRSHRGSIADPLAEDEAKGASPRYHGYGNGSADDAGRAPGNTPGSRAGKPAERQGPAPQAANPQELNRLIGNVPDSEAADLCRDYYPRSRSEIKKALERLASEQGSADSAANADAGTLACCRIVNTYRYLCGLSSDVRPDAALAERAAQFISAAKEQGSVDGQLQARFGCNVVLCNPDETVPTAFLSSFSDDAIPPVEQCTFRGGYMIPGLKAIGVSKGSVTPTEDAVAACLQTAAAPVRKAWSLPGEGFFPAACLPGRIWSVYTDGHLGTSLHSATVRVWKLAERPTAPLDPDKMPASAKPVRVSRVNPTDLGVDFVPELAPAAPGEDQIYAVSITTRKRVQGPDGQSRPAFEHFYIVDLF